MGTYMECEAFEIQSHLNPWEVNVMWGVYIQKIRSLEYAMTMAERNGIDQMMEYRFVGSDSTNDNGEWSVYVATDYEDNCKNDKRLAIFISTITKEKVILQFNNDGGERWGYIIEKGKVYTIDYAISMGALIHLEGVNNEK